MLIQIIVLRFNLFQNLIFIKTNIKNLFTNKIYFKFIMILFRIILYGYLDMNHFKILLLKSLLIKFLK
jgi:hypothetical protein